MSRQNGDQGKRSSPSGKGLTIEFDESIRKNAVRTRPFDSSDSRNQNSYPKKSLKKSQLNPKKDLHPSGKGGLKIDFAVGPESSEPSAGDFTAMPVITDRADFFSKNNDQDMIAEITKNVELDSSIKTASFKEPENDKFGEDKQGTDKPRLVLRRSSENADLCNMNPDTLEADVRESCPWSRDVEVALCDLMGGAARSSRNSFQQMALDWKKGYETYFSQPLSEERFPYIWADVKHYDLGNKTRKSYLTLTGCNLAGEYRLLALRETESDSEEVWEMLVRRLERRGLGDPKLFIGKADLPLWNVIPQVFPGAEIQFCWNAFIEKMLEYFPLDFSDEIEGRLLDIQHAETKQNAQDWIEYFKRSFGRNYLRAVNELLKCRANLLNFYSYPGKQWDNLRSGGFIKSGYPSRALLKTVCKYERMHDISLYLVFDCMIRSRSGWGRIKGRRALKNVQNGRRYINGKSVNPRRLKRIYHNADKKVRNDFGTKPGLISRLSSLFTNRNSETKNTHEESEAQADFESRLRIDSERSAAKRLSSESSEEPVENTLSEKI